MTTTPTTTAGERVEATLHQLAYLIGQHNLPAPKETTVRTYADVQADVLLGNVHDLNLWAEATDAAVTGAPEYFRYQYVACTAVGDVLLRMTAFGEALTP